MSLPEAHQRLMVAQPIGAGPPPAVGLVRWRDPYPRLTLFVKATFTLPADDDLVVLAPQQLRPSLAQPADLPGAGADELCYPSDFVPRKAAADVLVVGHAFADREATRIEASFRVADPSAGAGVDRKFSAVGASPLRSLPLCRASLRRAGSDEPAPPTGPTETGAEPPDLHVDFDFARYQSAVAEQRCARVHPDATIELKGLSRHGGRRRVVLAGVVPRARVIFAPEAIEEAGPPRAGPSRELTLTCDTLWLDTDSDRLVLVWRATIPVGSFDAHGIDRVVVWLHGAGAEPEHDGGPNARMSYAIEERDLGSAEAESPTDAEELAMARYGGWERTPEPTLPLERYAAIAAELAEAAEPRDRVLTKHELDEDGWFVEERAWLEKMADGAGRGDGSLAVEYGTSFIAAQDALGRPEENETSLDEYVALRAAIERALDPNRVLAERSKTLAQWMRLDRRWMQAAATDARVADDLEARLANERAKAGSADGEP